MNLFQVSFFYNPFLSSPSLFILTSWWVPVICQVLFYNSKLLLASFLIVLTLKLKLKLNCSLQGELTITADMEELGNALYLDDVPESWTRRAYPSMSGLAAWFVDLLLRIKELESWTSDFCLPNVVWLSGFFNPQSFLTAIEQSMARKNEWPLDKMALQVNAIKVYVAVIFFLQLIFFFPLF